ncbi:UNVERIFIED_CONTAM: hypothetical protein Slati_2130600 [Sesamum latifolium]|uniref:Uncharacterized protein n=1 Tax=Sesamum latifolium TaxID=2727402 RepID=A0AAW2WPZ7_9LAMI
MAVEGKSLLSHPKSFKDGAHQSKSDKFYRFHNDYGHTTEEYRHLKNEIKQLAQNEYLQEYICWEKARSTRLYQKYETDKDKISKNISPEPLSKEIPSSSTGGKSKVNDLPRKGVIRMIVGGPIGGDSQRARKTQIRETSGVAIKEVMDVEPAEDTPLFNSDMKNHVNLGRPIMMPWPSPPCWLIMKFGVSS